MYKRQTAPLWATTKIKMTRRSGGARTRKPFADSQTPALRAGASVRRFAYFQRSLFSILIIFAILVVGCNAETAQTAPSQANANEVTPANLSNGEKLKVVATTSIIGDLISNVGGDMIELTTMLPPGSDPHTFNPSPQNAAAVADSHVVFVNGLHLEEFLEKLIENAGGKAPVVAVSMNVKTREFEEIEDHADGYDEEQGNDDGHKDEHGHAHEGTDPHIWVTPANAIIMVDTIEQTLVEMDPANAQVYKANAETYQANLKELDKWVQAQIDSIPADNRKMVTDHDSFGYYADRYGLEIIGAVIPAASTNAEPSAQELAALQQQINKIDVKAVFVGTSVNPVLAERIAEDSGIKLVPLYTGSLGDKGSGVETYLDYIKYNTTAIVEALK